jgi:hypothetical protein
MACLLLADCPVPMDRLLSLSKPVRIQVNKLQIKPVVAVYISALQLVCRVSSPIYGLKQPRPLDRVGCQT